ncbi:hypothetical protein AN216_25315 [Streptomyces oceani]|uniref:Oxidoreductase n=1 Tax=Streptomyces oceani TaxID=1075402 RepID=A0A1E7JRH5_9ACTN|nr:hypothetical protein AN216_25315 [Streptomyces oceani]
MLVTGASGKTGRHVVAGLRAEGAAFRTAGRTAPPGGAVEGSTGHVRFDWADPGTYRPALAGVTRVYLVAPVGVLDPAPQIEEFLSVGRELGLRRAVFLSSDVTPSQAPGLDRAREAVRGMPEWAVLRPSWFMQNLIDPYHHMGVALRERDELPSATAGRGIGLVDAADIAAVAVRALLDERASRETNREYVITGPEVLTYDEVAARIGTLLDGGRRIRHVRLSPVELARHMTASGVPPEFARMLAEVEEQIAAGVEERVTSTVAEVTGHPARTFRDFVRGHRERFARAGR